MKTATRKKSNGQKMSAAAAPALVACSLHESVLSAPGVIDREAGVIHGVKIIGKQSKNGREYSEAALDEAARLYEGIKVNVDHQSRAKLNEDRPFTDGFGELRNVRRAEDGSSDRYGDLHFLKSHPLAEMVCESAERFPNQFGLSHHADGKVRRIGSKTVVESVQSVRSVDIVGRPATNRGIFESVDPSEEAMNKTTLKEFIEAIDASHAAKPVLVKLLEMDCISPDTAPDYSMDAAAPEMSADDQAKAAFNAMVAAVVADDTLDIASKMKRIKDILTAQEKLLNPDACMEEPCQTVEEPPAMESEMKQKLEHAQELLEAGGITKPSQAQIKALAAVDTSAERKSLIESWKPKAEEPKKTPKPAFSRPLMESQSAANGGNNGSYPADRKGFLRQLGVRTGK